MCQLKMRVPKDLQTWDSNLQLEFWRFQAYDLEKSLQKALSEADAKTTRIAELVVEITERREEDVLEIQPTNKTSCGDAQCSADQLDALKARLRRQQKETRELKVELRGQLLVQQQEAHDLRKANVDLEHQLRKCQGEVQDLKAQPSNDQLPKVHPGDMDCLPKVNESVQTILSSTELPDESEADHKAYVTSSRSLLQKQQKRIDDLQVQLQKMQDEKDVADESNAKKEACAASLRIRLQQCEKRFDDVHGQLQKTQREKDSLQKLVDDNVNNEACSASLEMLLVQPKLIGDLQGQLKKMHEEKDEIQKLADESKAINETCTASLRTQLQQHEKRFDDVQCQLQKSQEEKDIIQKFADESNANSEVCFASLRTQLQDQQKQIDDLQGRLQKACRVKDSAQKRVEDLQGQLQKVQEERDSLQMLADGPDANHRAYTASLKGLLQNQQKRIDDLQGQLQKAQEGKSNIQKLAESNINNRACTVSCKMLFLEQQKRIEDLHTGATKALSEVQEVAKAQLQDQIQTASDLREQLEAEQQRTKDLSFQLRTTDRLWQTETDELKAALKKAQAKTHNAELERRSETRRLENQLQRRRTEINGMQMAICDLEYKLQKGRSSKERDNRQDADHETESDSSGAQLLLNRKQPAEVPPRRHLQTDLEARPQSPQREKPKSDETLHSPRAPEGITQHRAENAVSEQVLEVRVTMLGYLFTLNRQRFWSQLGDVSHELKEELMNFGVRHPPTRVNKTLGLSDFEALYANDVRAAYAWQACYIDDVDELFCLLKSLRRVANMALKCWEGGYRVTCI